jgi:acyl-CoA thioester hydrolase
MAEIPFRHKTPVEIRFVDIDAFGHVNNANFLTYFEQARIKYFDDVVDWNYDLSKRGVVVARAEINYILPVRFRDQIVIHTSCSRIGNKSFDLQYRAFRIKEKQELLVADGITVMVAYDYAEGSAIEILADWKKALERFESSHS